MEGIWSGLLGGFIAWIATALIGQPIYMLCNLRGEAAKVLALYEPVPPERGRDTSPSWLEERAAEFKRIGSKLIAFAATHSLASALVKIFGIQSRLAGEAFMQLAEQGPGGDRRPMLRSTIAASLKIGI